VVCRIPLSRPFGHLAKVGVESSNLFARSKFRNKKRDLERDNIGTTASLSLLVSTWWPPVGPK
jgi:hypothetical protein